MPEPSGFIVKRRCGFPARSLAKRIFVPSGDQTGRCWKSVESVATIANYAKMFGMPVNFRLPADLPPIGVAVAKKVRDA